MMISPFKFAYLGASHEAPPYNPLLEDTMSKQVMLKRAQSYTYGAYYFRKGIPAIVPDSIAARLEEKVDSNDVPFFKVVDPTEDIPVKESVTEDAWAPAKGEKDDDFTPGSEAQEASGSSSNPPAVTGSIKIKKPAINEPTVTV